MSYHTVFHEVTRVLKPGGPLVLVDSLQRGDKPDYDSLLELFPHYYHEPSYAGYITEDFGAIAEACGLTDVGLAGTLGAMIFALPALRNALPGAPPFGVRGDLLIFFWAELAAIIALSLIVGAWAHRGAPH
jgi:hypothetical protein